MDPNRFKSKASGNCVLTQTGYWAFIPSPLPPEIEWSTRLVSSLTNAERELSRLNSISETFPFYKLLIQPFIRNEAVFSSRIEGTRSSLIDLFSYESRQLSFFEQTDDVKEVLNYARAMDEALERLASLPVSLRMVREIHARLMQGVRGGNLTPGEFRRSQNWIGPAGSTISDAPYVPPPVAEMEHSLDNLEKFIHSESEIPNLIRLALIHYQFEAIHPFLDGNGRVGRLLTVLLLCEWGLLKRPFLNISIYFESYRQEYYDNLLSVSQNGAWEDWLVFFLDGIRQQSITSVARIEKLQEVRSSYKNIVESDRNPGRMASVIEFIFSRPILSIRQAETGLGLSYTVVADYFRKLTVAGVIREVTGNSRNRLYQADEILKAIQG